MKTASLKETNQPKIRTAIIGCGNMAREHIQQMLLQLSTTEIRILCEPSQKAYDITCKIFLDAGLIPPINEPNLDRLLNDYVNQLDTAFIVTPHVLHFEQTKACLEAGLDVLLEKPMVMNAEEAQILVNIKDKTEKLLVVAFQGSLSPQIRKAVDLFQSGKFGKLLNIIGWVWEDWKIHNIGSWRMDPALAGGGFFFDSGAHLLNTVADLGGEDFEEVCAWLDNCDTNVDIIGSVMGRLKSGAMVSLTACGDTNEKCLSDIRVYCTDGIIRTGMWGERLEIQQGTDKFTQINVPPSLGVWEQFISVRNGSIKNPSPPEIGLRMAKLWDAIKLSSLQGGKPVHLKNY